MSDSNPSADRAWCRAALPRVSRTFALNIRVLADPFRGMVETAYLLCRAADALEDSWPGTPDEIAERFSLLLAALADDAGPAEALAARARGVAAGVPELELVAELPRVWRTWRVLPDEERGILAAGVRTLAGGMCRFAARAAGRSPALAYLDTEAELREYCWIVAGCVGVLLSRLFAATGVPGDRESEAVARSRLERAPAVGEALQLTNILLDWPLDVRRGRCYVPAEWLAEHGLEARDLVGAPRPGADALARRLESLARAALARVPEYLDTIPPRAVRFRLFTVWPALWALASLEHARSDPEFPWGARRPRLPRARLAREAWRGLAGHRGAALDRLRDATQG